MSRGLFSNARSTQLTRQRPESNRRCRLLLKGSKLIFSFHLRYMFTLIAWLRERELASYRFFDSKLASQRALSPHTSINQSQLVQWPKWQQTLQGPLRSHNVESPGNEKQNRRSIRCSLNAVNDEAEVTCRGSVFHMRAPATEKRESQRSSVQQPGQSGCRK